MIHILKYETAGLPERFTNPFRYSPDPLTIRAAEEVMARIDASPELRGAFSEGKMLGVLLVKTPARVIPGLTRNLPQNGIHYIAAFSGSVGGRSQIKGFVPPIFDLLDPGGHFKIHEAEITAVNRRINSLEASPELEELRRALASSKQKRDSGINILKARMAISKRERDEIRSELSAPSRLEDLIRESQHEKAELRRAKAAWEEKISSLEDSIRSLESEIRTLKAQRSKMSDELQEWIFRQYIVHNSLGEESSVQEIFAERGLVPPGGTGDCAAPKLLEYAFRNGLRPIAMGEFWYGKSPETAVRTHGHFYPSCTSKCGPLLGWMMRGMEISDDSGYSGCSCDRFGSRYDGCDGHELKTIFEDEVLIAVDKPSGMPSVPGLDGRMSALEVLQRTHGELFVVHRLDMDTSGILLFAKTLSAAVEMQKQFEDHSIRKTYRARLSAVNSIGSHVVTELDSAREAVTLKAGDKGRIELPLSPDYDERPRQKVDFRQGKPALTEYEVVSANEDGTTDIIFHPHTGRTHQLRVHAAHILGLARPIVGDLLYGGSPAPRLYLDAIEITFRHPVSGKAMTLNLFG